MLSTSTQKRKVKNPGLHEVCILVEGERQQTDRKLTDIMLEDGNVMDNSDTEEIKYASGDDCNFQ